jgi:hypothetical protein
MKGLDNRAAPPLLPSTTLAAVRWVLQLLWVSALNLGGGAFVYLETLYASGLCWFLGH